MADATTSRFLDDNAGGAPFDDLALLVYGGMVLEAFDKTSTTQGRRIERMIASGKSAQFPVIGRMGTTWHSTAGAEVVFDTIDSSERIIEIQGLLLAPLFIDVLDEAKSHFDIRRPYATKQGVALANEDDLRTLMAIAAGARATATITASSPADDGVRVTGATIGMDAAVLKSGIYDLAEEFDLNDVPSDRFLWLSPAQFYLLLQDGEFLDRDFGGDGSRATAVMRNAADFTVVKTNNMPSTSEVGDTTFPSDLRVDYTTTVAVAAHPSSTGSLSLIGLQFESEYDMNRQGHMLIAKYAKGHNYLRPEACGELATA